MIGGPNAEIMTHSRRAGKNGTEREEKSKRLDLNMLRPLGRALKQVGHIRDILAQVLVRKWFRRTCPGHPGTGQGHFGKRQSFRQTSSQQGQTEISLDIHSTAMYNASMLRSSAMKISKELVAASATPLVLSILAGGESY